MFSFEYWFSGIIGTCELITNKDAFYRTWVLGDHSLTSIHYYDELFEQLVGDLHLDDCIQQFAADLERHGAFKAFVEFSVALHTLDRQIESLAELRNSAALLNSREWADF